MPIFSRYPVLNLGAEYLAMGLLMRRNIMAYKAPPNNEGYDIICIHPDPRKSGKQIRVQVKSRIASDSDKGVLVKPKTVDAFDYLMVVYLNVGYFLRMAKTHPLKEGEKPPEIMVIPAEVARSYFLPNSKWGKVRFTGLETYKYAGSAGIELIAKELEIPYPSKARGGP
jgi:hypothetical protein